MFIHGFELLGIRGERVLKELKQDMKKGLHGAWKIGKDFMVLTARLVDTMFNAKKKPQGGGLCLREKKVVVTIQPATGRTLKVETLSLLNTCPKLA